MEELKPCCAGCVTFCHQSIEDDCLLNDNHPCFEPNWLYEHALILSEALKLLTETKELGCIAINNNLSCYDNRVEDCCGCYAAQAYALAEEELMENNNGK